MSLSLCGFNYLVSQLVGIKMISKQALVSEKDYRMELLSWIKFQNTVWRKLAHIDVLYGTSCIVWNFEKISKLFPENCESFYTNST